MKRIFTIIGVIFFLLWTPAVFAAMSGGAYELYSDTFNFADTQYASGGAFSLNGTGGEIEASSTGSNTFELRGALQTTAAITVGTLSFTITPSSISFGQIGPSSVSAANIVLEVTTNSGTGYSTTISADGDLRSGSNTIHAVSDGSVTAGSEEYGIRTSGGDGVLSSDKAISNNLVVASNSGSANAVQTTVNFRASAEPTTMPGTYTQVVTFTTTVNP